MDLPAAGRLMDGRDDRTLMAAHVAGDPDAFTEVVRRHRDRLWAVALRTTGHPEDAADAVQDAFVSALRAAGGYRGDAEVSTWLHRIVVNACIDRARRAAVRPTVPLDAAVTAMGAHRIAGAGSSAVVDGFGRVDEAVDLERALAMLPMGQRLAVVLVDVQDGSVAHAAAVLGVPEGTVKSRCARGRARLAELLAPGNRTDAGYVRSGVASGPPTGGRNDQVVPGREEQA